MITTDTITEVLNDLVAINNDRIKGYENALKELEENKESNDTELKELFLSMIRESQTIKMDLGTEIQAFGGTIDNDTTVSGKIYRTWMDLKVIFTGKNRKSILISCEFGEDAAQKAYDTALSEEDLPAYITTMLQTQRAVLKTSHDTIKKLRDETL